MPAMQRSWCNRKNFSIAKEVLIISSISFPTFDGGKREEKKNMAATTDLRIKQTQVHIVIGTDPVTVGSSWCISPGHGGFPCFKEGPRWLQERSILDENPKANQWGK